MKHRSHQIVGIEPYQYKNRVVKWLYSDTEPTKLEMLLCGILSGLVLFKFILEATA